MKFWTGLALASAAAMLAACGGGSDPGGSTDIDLSGARGSLMYNPPLQVTAMGAADFTARLQVAAPAARRCWPSPARRNAT